MKIGEYEIKMPQFSQPGGGVPKVLSRNPLGWNSQISKPMSVSQMKI